MVLYHSYVRRRVLHHYHHSKIIARRNTVPNRARFTNLARCHVQSPVLPVHIRQFSNQAVQCQRLTHIDADGRPNMVNVSNKATTTRMATASGRIILNYDAFSLLSDGGDDKNPRLLNAENDTRHDLGAVNAKHKARSKGDVLTTAQLAAIMASKQTSLLIPLCHPLPVTHVSAEFILEPKTLSVQCTATVRCDAKTGAEMEALTAVSIGLLTIWDMVKAVAGKEMIIKDIMVIGKSGGKGGEWTRSNDHH